MSWTQVLSVVFSAASASAFWLWRERQLRAAYREALTVAKAGLEEAWRECHAEQQGRLRERRKREAAEKRVRALLRELRDIDTDDETPI